MYHRYHIQHEADGDYVVLESWGVSCWTEHTRWLIPGTELED